MFPDITRDDIFRIETEHLWLRWLRAADAPALTAFASLESVAQMTASIPHPYPAGEAARFILAARAATASGQALILAMTLKTKTRPLVGLVSAESERRHEIEIGYVTAPTHANRGYATESVRVLLDTIFNLTEARNVIAASRTNNPASRRVLEKCGFVFVETALKDLPARGGRHPCDCFSLTRRAWLLAQREARLPPMHHQSLAQQRAALDEQSQQSQQ